MKKTQKQSGFAHLIIVVIILAVALVGTLGFVFWQNFMQPKASVSKVESVAEKSDSDAVSDSNSNVSGIDSSASTKGFLVLEDWGVKFKLPSTLGNNQITYYKVDSNSYRFSTTRVEAIGGRCVISGNDGGGSLGYLARVTELSTAQVSPPTLASKLDGYYFYYTHPQAACSDNSTDVQITDTNMIQKLLMSVEKK